MTTPSPPHSIDVHAVRGILERLRKLSGMRGERNLSVDIGPLLKLVIVRRYAHLAGTTPVEALPHAIRYLAGRLAATDQLIIDAELCLEMLSAVLPSALADRLYGPNLGMRRRCLAENWQVLYEAVRAPAERSTPTARALRAGAPETEAFTALSTLLISESVVPAAEVAGAQARSTVVVVGDAAWDRIHTVETFPRPGSSLFGDFDEHPGGKGLNRAVALARLELDARLFAAVSNDDNGEKILTYLHSENVDTSLIPVISGYRTPVATVIMSHDGSYTSIANKQDRIWFAARDIDDPIRQALRASAAVLLTFEQSDEVMAEVIDAASQPQSPPWLLVNASPPRQLSERVLALLGKVDYLIGTADELAGMRPGGTCADTTRELLELQVGAVVVIDGSQCAIHFRDRESIVAQFPSGAPGSGSLPSSVRSAGPLVRAPGMSPAFISALIYRLVTRVRPVDAAQRRHDDERTVEWAAAAVSAREDISSIPASMPRIEAIDKLADAEDSAAATVRDVAGNLHR
ncbi:carbohydrate kinase family protein [Nocardia sp. NBC_01327]|uniref:carbohydrate kinase family protein n=1 Tax=Nocardia sp. NBC_01327 TaxID=2903593 RepID=UPI002E0ED2B4|nr:carbohydrate kinase family protein [Nocardia sp. NBC_01327]